MACQYGAVLFDLDGTLTESAPGILHGVTLALTQMNLPLPGEETLRRFIGPPLWYSFTQFCGLSPQQAEQAVLLYRAFYNEKGALENAPFPGVRQLLQRLSQTGAALAVATGKPENVTKLVLTHFDLMRYFTCVCSPTGDEHNSTKAEIISRALSLCGVSPKEAVMVGDTRYDAQGARDAGTNFIGVLYGYGTRAEMEEQGARVFAENTGGLSSLLIDKCCGIG